jgi:hypothetical protein
MGPVEARPHVFTSDRVPGLWSPVLGAAAAPVTPSPSFRTAAPAALALIAACTTVGIGSTTTTVAPATTTAPTTTTTIADCSGSYAAAPDSVEGDDTSAISVAISQLTFDCAHEAVVTADTMPAIRAGAALASGSDVPLLVEGAAVTNELDRLGVRNVTWVGVAPAPAFGVETEVVTPSEVAAEPPPPTMGTETIWVLDGDPDAAPIVEAAARPRGHGFVDVTGFDDIRTAPTEIIGMLREAQIVPVAVTDDRRWQLETVRSAPELPGAGLTFDRKRLVAFYGNPTTGALGVLGEQDPAGTLERLLPLVDEYSTDGLQGIPTFEIIATVASARAGVDDDYSDEASVATLRPWIDYAAEHGMYVILDLQPGRTDFLTQARLYEELLRLPHVGLALDPEWRLKPGQVHLRQIGTVDAAEINQVSAWLAGIVREERLPQKYFIVHQFRFSMITDRDLIETPPELFTVIQMDGQGPLPTKYETYAAITAGQVDVGWSWGWKNFYDEDSPMATPAQVLAVEPPVVFVSFQ